MKSFFFCLLSFGLLVADKVETFFGPVEVEEPVILELINCPAVQRLKSIHQYGVAYYYSTSEFKEEFTRYDHSLGVFAILRAKGASLEEQLAGLLHDVSHTAFSHVGDWVFRKEHQEIDYHTFIHKFYVAVSGVELILNKYGFSAEQILPKNPEFIMLEQQALPNLNADRIDYNIQGAYYQKFITKEEAIELFHDVHFAGGRWLFSNKDLATKLLLFSVFMTEHCWTSATNHLTSQWLADAILQGIKLGVISWYEFQFGIDQVIWNKLLESKDPLIVNRMRMIAHPHYYFRLSDPCEANLFIKFRNRGIDPWIVHKNGISHLTTLQPELAAILQNLAEKAERGWAVSYSSSCEVNR